MMEERIVETIPDPDGGTCDFGAVGEAVIRCRDCDGSKRKGLERCPTFEAHGKNPDGFCAWAERDE